MEAAGVLVVGGKGRSLPVSIPMLGAACQCVAPVRDPHPMCPAALLQAYSNAVYGGLQGAGAELHRA
jgi:hypothetical protein